MDIEKHLILIKGKDKTVLSSFLCKIFISRFLKEWQTLTHFSDRV